MLQTSLNFHSEIGRLLDGSNYHSIPGFPRQSIAFVDLLCISLILRLAVLHHTDEALPGHLLKFSELFIY